MTATELFVGKTLLRLVDLGLRDDVLLLAIGMELEVRANPGDAKWKRAAARVHRGLRTKVTVGGEPAASDARDYWLSGVLRQDLPRHVPAHEQPDGPVLHCIAPMVRRPLCGREVNLRPWSFDRSIAIPVLVGGQVAWHAYCRQHRDEPHPQRPSMKVTRKGEPEAYEAAKRLRHNVGGQLRDAFPTYRIEEAYKWVDKRWEPDDRPVEAVRLRLVPPLEPAERQ